MELWRALHYGKHLVNRELNKAGLSQYCSPKAPEQVPPFFDRLKQCVIQDEVVEVHASSAVEEMANLNQPEEEVAPTPVKKPAKAKAKPASSDEESFEGLKD